MALFGVADRDGMDHDVVLAELFQPGGPPIGEVLAIGEHDEGPSLSVLPRVDGLERLVQASAQVGPAGSNHSGSQPCNASSTAPRFSVSGQRSTPRPAKATTAARLAGSRASALTRLSADSIATANRLGTASSAAMLRLTSTSKTTS